MICSVSLSSCYVFFVCWALWSCLWVYRLMQSSFDMFFLCFSILPTRPCSLLDSNSGFSLPIICLSLINIGNIITVSYYHHITCIRCAGYLKIPHKLINFYTFYYTKLKINIKIHSTYSPSQKLSIFWT